MVTIKDIALKADVSTATVSRILNGKPASEKTKIKVLQIVKKLNYIPDARACELRTNKRMTLGVIIPDISNPFYPASIKAFYDTAKSRGYHIMLGNTYGKVEEEIEVIRMMAKERIMGLMLETCEGEEDWVCYPLLKAMIDSGVSVVLLGKKRNGLNADMITVDHKSGAYKAVNYLIRTGRGRIAFICGSKNDLSGEQRYSGYCSALRDKGIKKNNGIVSFGDWTLESGSKQAGEILRHNSIDSIFCANDLLAMGAVSAIKDKGLKIPDDIAVVGFDDIQFSSFIHPKLTTIRQPVDLIAFQACNLIIDRIEGKYAGEIKEIILEPELIVRESA